MGWAFLYILLLDLAFIAVCVLAVLPLAVYRKAAWAVLKRNFVGYFTNPTGYVFLCLFVVLTSIAAFCPHEFFTANLANLDQLNEFLPYIMLVFIPAITMSIWSDERRQGTDELLLTLPADDFDIVIGKYLAAAAVFTASLIFSQFSNYIVLAWLTEGYLDTGLFFATYLGYWLVGLAMLAIGMVASFLTPNMTVGFILGAMFNAPLAFAARADVIIRWTDLSRIVSFWSLSTQLDDFGRGVISLSSLTYFLLIIALGLYLSMVLIGSRHWSGGRDGQWMFSHYVGRAVALVVTLVAAVVLFSNYDRRIDVSAGRVSSLSPKTKELITNLDPEHPISVEAFVSAQVPELYVQTRYSLVSLLKEFDAMSGGKINVRIHNNLEPFSEQAALAEQRFGIQPTMIRSRSRGAFKDEEVIFGAAISSGLEKVVVPFFDYGVPVEYELIRSIGTVSEGERRSIGIVRTDAQLYGGFSFAGGMPQQIPKQEIVDELEKQYDVEEVDPTSPLEVGKYDVLLVVQPSSLGPAELSNLVAAVRDGQPTAIFEDPMPIFLGTAPGTGEPKQAPGGMFGGGGGPQPKGNIRELWDVIGIDPPGEPSFQPGSFNPDVAWQRYNPYPKLQIRQIPDTWVFASSTVPGGESSFNPNNPMTRGLTEVLFPVPGMIEPSADSDLEFTKLVSTTSQRESAGRIRHEQVRSNQQDLRRLRAAQGPGSGEQILAAHITEVVDDQDQEKDQDGEQGTDAGDAASGKRPINVVYVADIDLMVSVFLRLRARPEDDEEIDWRFENVNFLLNIIDSLSGDDDYVEIRMRKPYHATLKVVEDEAGKARDEEFTRRLEFQKIYDDEVKKLDEEKEANIKKFQDRVEELQKKQRDGEDVSLSDLQAAMQQRAIKEQRIDQKHDVRKEQLERQLNNNIEQIRREADLEILKIQNGYKVWAVLIPPIPPLLVGLVVFVHRRLREREGVAKSRLR